MRKWRRSISGEFFHPDLIDTDVVYPDLPDELDPYIFGFLGIGPCVMAISEKDFAEAVEDGDLDLWENGIPCKLFMQCPYRFYNGYIIVDLPSDDEEYLKKFYEPEKW